MITKLSGEAGADAIENARCNEEMGKTEAKKADLESTVWGSQCVRSTRSGSIINILEVFQSDFSNNLAKDESQEAHAQLR